MRRNILTPVTGVVLAVVGFFLAVPIGPTSSSVPNGVDYSDLARSRARIYRILSITYARPADEQLVEQLRSWEMLPRQFPQRALPWRMKQGLREIEVWIESHSSPSSAELRSDLGVQFTHLFRGLNRFRSPPPPYESVYGGSGWVFDELTLEVYREYCRFGLEPIIGGLKGEPPDHISFELEFMALLSSEEAEAWEKGDKDEASRLLKAEEHFLREHLSRWVPVLSENIRKFDKSGLYSGLANVTEGWIQYDQKLIKRLIDL